MGKNYSTRYLVSSLVILIISVFSSLPSYAMTYFYVDPDWNGSQAGDTVTPWMKLTSAAWTTINNALATDDVTVYFSARESSSDINEENPTLIQINRADTGTKMLILDGMSKYNINDTSPSWYTYSGSSKAQVPSITTNNASSDVKRNHITIRGFYVKTGKGVQAVYLKNFSYGLVEYCYLTHTTFADTGPSLMITYDNTNNTTASATRSQSVVIQNNTIEDNFGEAIYVNGCKDKTDCFIGQDNITIQNNIIINPGSKGGEGDGIDIKNNCTNCIVRKNTIAGGSGDGIISHSGMIIESNFIYNTGNRGIGLVDYDLYDHHDVALDSGDIKNNIIINTLSHGIHLRSYAGDYDFRNIKIRNNTIFKAGSYGIYIHEANQNIEIVNNIVSKSKSTEFYADAGTLGTHGFNIYYDDDLLPVYHYGATNKTITTLVEAESNSLGANPLFIDINNPYTSSNFRLQANSPAIGKGLVINEIIDDFGGSLRKSSAGWDIGAIKFKNPSSPTLK